MQIPLLILANGESWLERFVPFTMFHIATVAVCAAAMLGACWLGRKWHPHVKERKFRLVWGWAVLIYQTWYVVWYALPSRWDWKESLPLQLCDLAAFVAGMAMVTQWHRWRTLLYFWGIGLSTQAFLTPTLDLGIMHTKFWLFWVGHTAIVGSAVYDVVVRGFRPRARDLGFAILFTSYGVLLVFYFNVLLTDLVKEPISYWYVGPSKPEKPTIIDELGPWPLRVLWLSGIVICDFILLWAVWPALRKLTGGRDPVATAAVGND